MFTSTLGLFTSVCGHESVWLTVPVMEKLLCCVTFHVATTMHFSTLLFLCYYFTNCTGDCYTRYQRKQKVTLCNTTIPERGS